MNRTVRLALILTVVCSLAIGIIGCKSDPTATPETDAIRAYADPATETTLQGLSQNDLEQYTRYGNAAFKAAVTQEILTQTADQLNAQLGDFSAIKFLRTESEGGYTIVHYQAQYAEGEIGIRMIFDQNQLIAGQWFE